MLAPAVADLVEVMRHIRADRTIGISIAVAPDVAVAVDPQDLHEMVGNLLDNGWRHARSTMRIDAIRTGTAIALTIEDDGLGLSEDALVEALVPRRRLDERGDGHGFGLSIAQELAELSGGTLNLGQSMSLGGLRVALTLPASLASF